ncbi:hypothetical protein EDD16DRAFT_1711592 [Pisolithus croceorrhizus]|nr:hypothetical protein EDD16DRAFT_1711592 [Pisolithus croceorrhizus]
MSPADPLVKIGPPIGARRSKRIQATVLSSTKTQPSHGAKAHCPMNQPVATRSRDTTPENNESSLVAQPSTLKPHPQRSSQGLTTEECKEQYLNSFHTKIVVLKDGTKLNQCTALEQLHKGTITVQDIDIEDGCEQSGPLDMSSDAHLPDEDDHHESSLNLPSENVSNDQSMQSEEDEWAIENVMQSEHADVPDLGEVNHASDAEDEHAASPTDEPSNSEWSVTERHRLKCEQTVRKILAGNYDIDTHPSPLDFPTSSKDTMDIEDTVKYRKPKRKSDHVLTKASEAPDLDQEDEPGTESNLYAHRHGRLPLAAIKKAQELGMHTAQEAQAIADEYGKTLASIMAAAGLTTKATWAESVWNMHQAWYAGTNPKMSDENLKDYYYHQMKQYESHKDEEEFPDLWVEIWKFWSESISGTKDMSSKAIVGQLMTCRDSFTQAAQTWCNVENIHVFGCVIYTGNDKAACQAQGIFAGSSLCTQLAGVPAISQHFNVKCLTADELCALTLPFLKEQMGNDYHTETRIDDDDEHGDYIVPEPASSFSLKPWTADQLALVHMMNPKAFEIPLVMDTFGQPLCLLSDLQAFLKVVPRGMHHEATSQGGVSTPTPTPSSPPSKQVPARGHAPLQDHHTSHLTLASHNSPLPPSSPPDDSSQSS